MNCGSSSAASDTVLRSCSPGSYLAILTSSLQTLNNDLILHKKESARKNFVFQSFDCLFGVIRHHIGSVRNKFFDFFLTTNSTFLAFAAGQTSSISPSPAALQKPLPLSPETALQRYGSSILRLALSYLHNMADAEDILQDTMLRLLSAAPVFESPEHEKAWLLRVAINLCKNHLKASQKRAYEELSESLACDIPDDLSFVWEAVSALPVKYREVIHLFYQEELSTSEIALLLDSKEATIRSLLFRAREKLRKQLKEAYDFEE